MAVETLRPNAAGDLTQCTPRPAVANYLNVDEVEADSATTAVYAEDESITDLYNLQNSGVGAGVITNVRVCVRASIRGIE
jgi:hypothetical protein